jgi:hypothetical protein
MKTPIFILRNAWNMEVKIQKSFTMSIQRRAESMCMQLVDNYCLLVILA